MGSIHIAFEQRLAELEQEIGKLKALCGLAGDDSQVFEQARNLASQASTARHLHRELQALLYLKTAVRFERYQDAQARAGWRPEVETSDT